MFLDRQVCVVTGASTGIGRCLAIALADEGGAVALVGRDYERLQRVRTAINAKGGIALAYQTNLSDPAAIDSLVNSIIHDLGRVDVLANVAAAWHDKTRAYCDRPIFQTPAAEILEVIDVEIRAPLLLSARFLPSMISQRGGHVINVSSVFRDFGAGRLHHFTAKRALEEFTRGLADEVAAFGVRVNCVALGDVATESFQQFFPDSLATALDPADVVRFVLMLLSQASDHVNGQVIELSHRSKGDGRDGKLMRQEHRGNSGQD